MARSDDQARRDGGPGAVEVFRALLGDGVGAVEAIRSIRELFGLSLVEAKEVMVQAEGWAGTLNEHQQQVILPVVEACLGGGEKKSCS